MSQEKVIITLSKIGAKTFTMPPGFESSVEIHCWGAGGGSGRGGAQGGGGGYAKTIATIQPGDKVALQIGQPGGNGSYPTGGAGGLDSTFTNFRGGNAGNATDEDGDTGAGGGGGGASWVSVNGSYICVAAGGGGGGGLGDDGRGGNPGAPGGVQTQGAANTTYGQSSTNGYSTGGGGGAGYPFGGAAGATYGDDAGNPPGGSGGQNHGDVTVTGIGPIGAGKSVAYYPSSTPNAGDAGFPGYIYIIATKKSGIQVKISGVWRDVIAPYVKIPLSSITTQQTKTVSTTYVSPSGQASFSTVGTGVFTVPPNVTSLNVTVRGGDGGGGGGHSPCGNSSHKGGNGGDGASQSGTIPVSPGQTISYSVGRGGAGGGVNAAGGTGGSTSFAGLSAAGGPGGRPGTSNGPGAAGGNGGGGKGGNGSPSPTAGSSGNNGSISVSWTPEAFTVSNTYTYTVTNITGGWSKIKQIYTKINGVWRPVSSASDITLYNL